MDENLEQTQVNDGVTVDTKQEEVVEQQQPQEDLFTQDQVNDFVRSRLNKFYNRYGVDGSKGLDELVGKAQSYSVMEERYKAMEEEKRGLMEKIAFMENNINPNRYEDVRAYFKGKEIEFNNDSLVNELATHPEWLNQAETREPMTTIKTLGSDTSTVPVNRPNEKDEVAKLFGLKKLI